MPLRVLLDTNIFISYLLIPFGNRTPNLVVDAAIRGGFTPLISDRLVGELVRRVVTKPYLARRITESQLVRLVETLNAVAEHMPPLPAELPSVGHDRKDDVIFAHAVVERPFCIVSGDKGVQKVREIDGIPIYSPADFVQLLRVRGIIASDQLAE